jgi:hypothetical protein
MPVPHDVLVAAEVLVRDLRAVRRTNVRVDQPCPRPTGVNTAAPTARTLAGWCPEATASHR